MTSKDVEAGRVKSGGSRRPSRQQSAWLEDEIQELSLSSTSPSSSDEKRSRRRKKNVETVLSSPVPSRISTKEYPQVVIAAETSHQRQRQAVEDVPRLELPISPKRAGNSDSPRPEESSDTDYDVLSPISNTQVKTVPKSKTSLKQIEALSSPSQVEKDELGSDIRSLSSRRMSAGDSSLDGSRSITSQSQSETRSYRDRLRDRFHSVKERVGGKVARPRHQIKENVSKREGMSSRVDEMLQKEELEVEAALEKHEQARNRGKQGIDEKAEETGVDSSYDFFTRVWEPDPVVVGSPLLLQREEEKFSPTSSADVEEHIESADDKAKLLAADYLGLERDEWEVVDHSAGPILPEEGEFAAKERELYFYPKSDPVLLEDRLPPGQEVRFREEEGLYTGQRPKTRKRNYHRLEQRLLALGDTHWFGDDGELIISSDPIKAVPYRPPPVEDQLVPQLDINYVPATMALTSGGDVAIEGVNHALLEIHIGTLQFHHHPLFSQEHVLAQQLSDLYNQYRHRMTIRHEERLSGRLDSLRQAFENIQATLNASAADVTPQQLDRMKKYKEDIRSTRQQLLAESVRGRKLLASLLSCWRDLKKLREGQGYVCTPHRVSIHRERMSQEEMIEERVRWEAEIRQASLELEAERQEEYSQQWDVYQQNLELWRNKQAKLTAKSQKQKKEQSPDKDTEEGDEEQTNSDQTSQSPTLPREAQLSEEPTAPQPVDIQSVKTEVMDSMIRCLRPPGEPKLKIILNESERVDDDPREAGEKQRRNALKRCQLFVRIFYNNKEVCRTQSQCLTSRFKVVFNECFAIRLMQPPESIQIALFEDGAGAGRHVLAQIFLPIPTALSTLNSVTLENHEFSSDRMVSFTHAGVGSGVFISGASGIKTGCLYTSGVLSCRSGWGIDSKSGQILAPKDKYLPTHDIELHSSGLLAQLGKEGTLDVDKLNEWAQKSQLDPYDPANAAFFYFIKNTGGGRSREPDYFRLDPLLHEFDFCDMNTLETNPRLRLLHLRAGGEPEFKEWKLVPNREREIPTDTFKVYEKRVTAHAKETELEVDLAWPDPLSAHRAWGRLYLERVYQRVLAQCRQAQRTASLHHVVAEDQVPDISTLGLTFMKWLQPNRPLRPMRKERKKVAVQSLAGQEVKLIVNVIRAFEVPVRKNTDTLLGAVPTPPLTNLGFATVPVRPFVEVSFQGATLRTTTAEGANPTWNQDIQIPVRPGSSESDSLFIHLFDEVLVDLIEDERVRETNVHQRLERHWLASLHVPFSTLVHNSRIEGTFKMYSPPVLLGYERESHQRGGWQSGTFSLEQGGQLFPQRDATFINLFITVQPALNPPEPFNERLDSSEVATLEQHLVHFEKEVELTVPHRRIKTLVIDVSGKSVCITRFFRPLTPPALSDGETPTEEMAARFVSMVPVAASQGMFDVWLTCDQVLRLGWGDAWAHAVLLCCYFLGIGRTAWLLVGTGIPHGQTAYVFVREKQDQGKPLYWVWDPIAGQKYSIFDSFCPLQHVYGLINEENIWVNVQKEELPRRTQFDLNRRSDWLPALGRGGGGSVSAPVGSVQPTLLQYTPTTSSAANALQDKLEKCLRDALMKWRRTQTTHWNRYCIAMLRKLLPRLEQASWMQSGENVSPHHTRELQHILASHKMCGFPINLPYTTVDAVMDAVCATGVHRNQDDDAEFALAVYVHPFPNNVLSVWVYIASLTKRR